MGGRIEKALRTAANARGYNIYVCGISPAEQLRRNVNNRITGFYVRRNWKSGLYAVTDKYRWPTLAQVNDPAWLDSLMAEVTEYLDRSYVKQSEYAAKRRAEHEAETVRLNAESRARKQARRAAFAIDGGT